MKEFRQKGSQGKVGITLGHDLSLLAKEIDSVVNFNGGNSYVVHSWQWVVVSSMGSTAPLVEISVLNCDGTAGDTDTKLPIDA